MKHFFVLIVACALTTGLSFAQTNKPLKSVPEAGKVIALTFDDGIEPGIHKEMLKILKKGKAKATFFFLGNKLSDKRTIKRTIRRGHEIGNHSMTHPKLPEKSDEVVHQEIMHFQQVMLSEFKYTPKVFRAPFLQYDQRVFKILGKADLIPVNATVGTRDYAVETSVEYIIESATRSPKLGDGSIILMHEVSKTVEALPEIIKYYKDKGYTFVTVSELMALRN